MAVIVGGARTPIGKLLGSLSGFSATDLGGIAIESALGRSGVQPNQVDYVIMGQVLQAGCGQLPARQAAVKAGIPMSVPALTVNKVCLSGIDAIAMANQLVEAGEFDVVVAGGMESMTNAPRLLPGSRQGHKLGDITVLDHMTYDGLYDVFTDQPMGALTEATNGDLTREEQDEFAARSHQRAAAAWKNGLFTKEVVAIDLRRDGDLAESVPFTYDEGIRANTTVDTLARLRPTFRSNGTITAGSASQISDGACAVVVMSEAKADYLGVAPLARIVAHGVVAGPDSSLQHQPADAIRAACIKAGVDPTALDLIEINEAFAAVAVTSMRKLGLTPDRVNVNGGAIALGHPIGMSGARLVLHLALELHRRGGGIGASALCGGGGQGDALVLRVPA
jgi:acetyl-CoA C-acetyltransferase